MFGPAKPHVESQRPNKTKSTSLWSLMSSLRDAEWEKCSRAPAPSARPARTKRQCGSTGRHGAAGAPGSSAEEPGWSEGRALSHHRRLPRKILVTTHVISPVFSPARHALWSQTQTNVGPLKYKVKRGLICWFLHVFPFSLSFSIPLVVCVL